MEKLPEMFALRVGNTFTSRVPRYLKGARENETTDERNIYYDDYFGIVETNADILISQEGIRAINFKQHLIFQTLFN